LARVRQFDAIAWQRLSELYGPMVYGWARRRGLQDSDAADVTQETFRAVAGSIAGFRRDRPSDSFRGWLWTIARNKIRDHFRQREADLVAADGNLPAPPLDEIAALPETPESDPEEIERLKHRALELVRPEFSQEDWQVFLLVGLQGTPPKEVARERSVSVWSVYQIKSRVQRRLREELKGLLDF
jgi:RNA polymerase sigma-70 factor (ECF subfamily)